MFISTLFFKKTLISFSVLTQILLEKNYVKELMSSKSEFKLNNEEVDLLLCPFKNNCVLKQIVTCQFPDFYACPEYQTKKKKLLQ